MDKSTLSDQQNDESILPKEYACKYLCTGIDVGENRIVDSYSANLIVF